MNRLVRLAILAGVLAAAGEAAAADLSRPARPPYGQSEPDGPVAAIVIPDCTVRWGATLLGCLPRDEVDWADGVDLQNALRTVSRPRQLPYPQLLDRP